ncbi:hypothetical protein MMC34_000851, partial [Xylographa carneopallida]|nr:hypothetical protein [Xylographa carneopallida]
MPYHCPASSSASSPSLHCLLDCPRYRWYGFRRCLASHQPNRTPCSDECLRRVREDGACLEAWTAWQAAFDAAAAVARGALSTNAGVAPALAEVLECQQGERTRQRWAEASWREAYNSRRVRRGEVEFHPGWR